MAVLSDTERADLTADLMRQLSHRGIPTTLLKAQCRTLIDSTDDWSDANAVSFNTAIPAAVRQAASAQIKALAMMLVTARRWEIT